MPKKSSVRIWLEYLSVRLILGVFGMLPRPAAMIAGDIIARIGYHLLGGLGKVARRNLEIAYPDITEAERNRITKGTFRSLGRVLGEMSQFPRATPAKLEKLIEIDFDPELFEKYEKLRAEGRGAIIISPHLGNWELLVFAWSALFEPVSYLARPLDNSLIEDLTVRLRTRFGNRPINKTNAVPTAIKMLREGGLLGVLADVNAHPKEGVFVPFFGVPACTSSGVAMLAMRTNAIIIPLAGVWDEAQKRYKVVHGGIVEPASTDDRQRDVVDLTSRFTAEVEKLIRAYPDQWLWIHKRWKTRPPGEKDLYGRDK